MNALTHFSVVATSRRLLFYNFAVAPLDGGFEVVDFFVVHERRRFRCLRERGKSPQFLYGSFAQSHRCNYVCLALNDETAVNNYNPLNTTVILSP